ncbi:hypothetical protein TNCV_2377781 [Trichonephila clavipes]|nr:hypothetical protein TNCV_2377781 [Trichonephila clavipes]
MVNETMTKLMKLDIFFCSKEKKKHRNCKEIESSTLQSNTRCNTRAFWGIPPFVSHVMSKPDKRSSQDQTSRSND